MNCVGGGAEALTNLLMPATHGPTGQNGCGPAVLTQASRPQWASRCTREQRGAHFTRQETPRGGVMGGSSGA